MTVNERPQEAVLLSDLTAPPLRGPAQPAQTRNESAQRRRSDERSEDAAGDEVD